MSLIYKIVLTVVIAAALVIMHIYMINSNEKIVSEAINKPLTKIENVFEKMKVNRDGVITLDLKNEAKSVVDSTSNNLWHRIWNKE